MYFATDGILEQNSVHRTFRCVATVTWLIMAAPHWCFCEGQWLFIHMIYIKCLGFWLERERTVEKRSSVRRNDDQFGFGPLGALRPLGKIIKRYQGQQVVRISWRTEVDNGLRASRPNLKRANGLGEIQALNFVQHVLLCFLAQTRTQIQIIPLR